MADQFSRFNVLLTFPVKYGPGLLDPLRLNSYFALPRTLNGLADTKDETWRITEDALKTEGVSVVCRNNDYRVCLLVDQKNSTAGLRISVSTNLFFFSTHLSVNLRPSLQLLFFCVRRTVFATREK